MTGEALALLSALFYGTAGVAIARNKQAGNTGNGLLLSVILTAMLSGLIWLGFGRADLVALDSPESIRGILIFVAAGLFSIVLGRFSLFRATERLGAVRASLLRQVTPIFVIPFAFILLGTVLTWRDAIGGAFILAGVLLYLRPGASVPGEKPQGYHWATAAAGFYAFAYCLRSLGLESLPDPALGTFIGALFGLLWMILATGMRPGGLAELKRMALRNGRWQWLAALALSIGQTLQFFALSMTSAPVVAVLGTLEVFFAAIIAAGLGSRELHATRRLILCVGVAIIGTALLAG